MSKRVGAFIVAVLCFSVLAYASNRIEGQKTAVVSGTAYQLATSGVYKRLSIMASFNNTGTIYCGDSDVTTSTGAELLAGDSITYTDENGAHIDTHYIMGTVNNDTVRYMAIE